MSLAQEALLSLLGAATKVPRTPDMQLAFVSGNERGIYSGLVNIQAGITVVHLKRLDGRVRNDFRAHDLEVERRGAEREKVKDEVEYGGVAFCCMDCD